MGIPGSSFRQHRLCDLQALHLKRGRCDRFKLESPAASSIKKRQMNEVTGKRDPSALVGRRRKYPSPGALVANTKTEPRLSLTLRRNVCSRQCGCKNSA